MISDQTSRGIVRKQYRNSIAKEFFRKLIHICSALAPTMLAYAYWPVLALLFAGLAVYVSSELFRMHGIEVPVVARVTEIAARKRDENKFVLGPVTLVAGIIAAALLWHPQAARIGIYALAFGDGLASLGGKLFGRIHIPLTNGKTAAGSITCFTAVFCSAFAVCGQTRTALILACTAMVVEVIPLGDFDNVVIPVLIGGLAQALLP
jgi:Dolichol kinase